MEIYDIMPTIVITAIRIYIGTLCSIAQLVGLKYFMCFFTSLIFKFVFEEKKAKVVS